MHGKTAVICSMLVLVQQFGGSIRETKGVFYWQFRPMLAPCTILSPKEERHEKLSPKMKSAGFYMGGAGAGILQTLCPK